LFASRFRNFVVARCRSQGLNLSADELDLIEAWFAAPAAVQRAPAAPVYAPAAQPAAAQQQPAQRQAPMTSGQGIDTQLRADRWWSLDDGRQQAPEQGLGSDEFPRIIRTRLRG
jgi:hypothetical protein